MERATCPLSATQVLDEYFLENRARILDIAAFLDRVDRTADASAGRDDPRYQALLRSIEALLSGELGRARAAQLCFSDPSEEPLASAEGMKGAKGAWMGGER